MHYLSRLRLQETVVALQEVRQDEVQLQSYLRAIDPSVHVESSFGDSLIRGGVAVLIPPLLSSANGETRVESQPVVAGR
eukprot:3801342-Pyramimonas_sp.AAC.1